MVRSLRIEFGNLARYLGLREAQQPVIFTVWHAQLLLLMHPASTYQMTTLASPTRDGEIGACIGDRLGVVSIRGDERYGPLGALRQLLGVLHSGRDVGLFPDGPLGPAGRIKPGALLLAQRSACPILPLGAAAHWHLSIASDWDHFILPFPFSRIRIHIGEPVWIPLNADAAARERIGEFLASTMNTLTESARQGHHST